jgi:hypothetical protein
VSIELEASIREVVTLANVLAHAESLITRVPHGAFTVESSLLPDDIRIEPFEVEERGPRRYKDLLTIWRHDDLPVSLGPIAKVTMVLGYRAFPHEVDPDIWGRVDAEPEPGDDYDEGGFYAMVRPFRTRAAFCLAALLITSIADRSRSRIVDAENLLRQGRIVDPAALAAMFASYGDAASFEELADAFCDAIEFALHWPRAHAELARLKRSTD